MKGVLLKKLIGLGRDEDGAALVITLAMFMFLYAACAGVFAIGQTVKDKIHLQNACDAAAYSAAVVQADTLSRIATINRAMSWTYVSMTRRQMDYIVWKWLDHTWRHYEQDRAVAKSSGSPGIHNHVCWYIGTDPTGVIVNSGREKVDLNGSHSPYAVEVVEALVPDDTTVKKECENKFLGKHLTGDSFYCLGVSGGVGKLKANLDADFKNIEDMGLAEDELIKDLPTRMRNAAKEVLLANLPGDKRSQCRWFIERGNDYFVDLKAEDEDRFMGFAGIDIETGKRHFGAGSGDDEWFPRVDKSLNGIQRKYNMASRKLFSEWYWWAKIWTCTPYGCAFVHNGACDHSCPSCGSGKCDRCEGTSIHHAKLSAAHLHDKYYDGQRAFPKVLSKNYFGQPDTLTSSSGTITVGVATYNENPWSVLFRGISGFATDRERDGKFGIYGLFNPYRYVEWSWAISSAKAGYQHVDEDRDGSKREYRVNYDLDEKFKWNLCTSDWDAVFVPVRKSHAFAGSDKTWNSAGSDFLKDFVEGDWEPLDGSSSAPVYNVAGKMPNLPLMHNGGGTYRNLNWSRLADLMFH